MHKEVVEIAGLPIEIIRKSNLKNLYIRVNPPEGNVVVSAPAELKDEEIRLFVLRKLPEVTKVRDKMVSQARQTKREYVSGESHYLWGKLYRLQVVIEGNQYNISKTPTKIIFKVPEGATMENKERAFNEWYRQELKRVLQPVVERYEKRMGIAADEYKVKNMRTRWGTCNIDKRRVWINLQLAKKPMECLEYVVAHELVHLIEKDHTHRFNALVEKYYPTWKEAKKLLEELPLDHMEKGDSDTDDEQTNI